jgi:hypothetical protein
LRCALLLGTFVKGGTELSKGTHEVNAKISFGFVGGFNRFGNSFDGSRELLQGCMDPFQAGGNAVQKFLLVSTQFGWIIGFGSDHGWCGLSLV